MRGRHSTYRTHTIFEEHTRYHPPSNTHLAESVEDVGAVVGNEEGALGIQAVHRVLM